MTTQLLIYERAAPISSERHADWSVKTGADYSFARRVNSVPLMAAEFVNAAAEYPIVFAGGDETAMPAVALGIREAENLYVAGDGGWNAKYIPAFIRRYPFVFSSQDDGKNFTLCIDEEFSGCNQDGRGERLFDAEGQRTQYLENILGFLQVYQAHFQRTEAFCKTLKALDLLEPMQARFALGSGQQMQLSGFQAVNRDRLKALSGDQLSALARTDELELIYVHLQSLRGFTPLAERAGVNETEPAKEPEGVDA